MLEERAAEAPAVSAIAPDDAAGGSRPLADTPFARAVADVRRRMERMRPLVDQLALAMRIAEAPEGIDRATIPLAMPLGPNKLKELGALVRLSSFLKADIQAVIDVYRADVVELKRLERAAELEAANAGVAASDEAVRRASSLFSWLRPVRERFRDHPAIYELLQLEPAASEIVSLVPRALPEELADLLYVKTVPEPDPQAALPVRRPGLGQRLRASLARAFGGLTRPFAGGESSDLDLDDLKNPEAVMRLLNVPPLMLEVGLELVPLVDSALGGDLMERVVPMRVDLAMEMGFVTPGVMFKDNLMQLPYAYQFMVRRGVVARGEVMPGFWLAVTTPETEIGDPLPGFAATHPVTGAPATWVPPHQVAEAERRGYLVHDATAVITEHLAETLRAHAYDVLSYEEVQIMVNHVAKHQPTLVKHLLPERIELAELHQVLCALLRERVSIRDLAGVLEHIGHLLVFPRIDPNGGQGGPFITVHVDPTDQSIDRQFERLERALPRQQMLDTQALIEALRQSMGRDICMALADATDTLDVATIAPDLEARLCEAVTPGRVHRTLSLPPKLAERVLAAFSATCRHLDPPIVVCDARLRPALKRFLERALPRLHVLSHAELHPRFQVRTVATVGWDRAPGPREPD